MTINQEIKQVIVMRKDLNMRLGKMIAQGCHGSIMFLADYVESGKITSVQSNWLHQGMTKICVRVDSEEELLDLYNKAKAAGLICNLVTDAGLTEFSGVPTKTCLAIGPDYAEKINPITGHLKLL